MQPPFLRAVLAAPLAAAFLLTVMEPPLMHRCPVHSALPPADARAASGSHHAGTDAPSHQDEHQCCTCVGHCAVGTMVTAPPPAARAAVSSPVERAVGRRDAATAPRVFPYHLPYANGPPPRTG
jgi:hypothetical protein